MVKERMLHHSLPVDYRMECDKTAYKGNFTHFLLVMPWSMKIPSTCWSKMSLTSYWSWDKTVEQQAKSSLTNCLPWERCQNHNQSNTYPLLPISPDLITEKCGNITHLYLILLFSRHIDMADQTTIKEKCSFTCILLHIVASINYFICNTYLSGHLSSIQFFLSDMQH